MPRNVRPTPDPTSASKPERIAKVMARAGLCSRRDAERWIADGRVSVNGRVLDTPAVTVAAADRIVVDGRPIDAREPTRLFLFHKPRGLVTTARDPEGRPTIFETLPPDLPRVVSVGRLDINTEGLLLLTNDGGLKRVLELPATGWLRRYRVRANGETTQAALDRLRDGVTLDGVRYAGVEATLDRVQGANCWLTLGLREGKNREVKRLAEHLGLVVTRLIRVSFGPFQLGDLAPGQVEEVRPRVLRDQLGDRLAAEAGTDFTTPRRPPPPPAPLAPRAPNAARSRRPEEEDERPRPARAAKGRPAPERPKRGPASGDRPAPAKEPRGPRPPSSRPPSGRPPSGGPPSRPDRSGAHRRG